MKNKFIYFLPNGFGDIVMSSPSILNLLNQYENINVVVKSNAHISLLNELGIYLETTTLDTNSKKSIFLFFLRYSFRKNILFAPLLSSRKFVQIIFSISFKIVYVPKKLYNFSNLYELGSFNQQGDVHLVDYLNNILVANNILNTLCFNSYPKYVSNTTVSKVRAIGVGLSCGELERHKIPSPNIFADFLNLINSDKYDYIYLFGTKVDNNLFDEFKKYFNHSNKIKYYIDLPFNDLRKKISQCILFVSGTTGQGHIASTTNIPMVVFSGVTHDLASGPIVNSKLTIKHDLPCGPCYEENFLFGCGRKCMNEIFIPKNKTIFLNYINSILDKNVLI